MTAISVDCLHCDFSNMWKNKCLCLNFVIGCKDAEKRCAIPNSYKTTPYASFTHDCAEEVQVFKVQNTVFACETGGYTMP